MPDNNPEPHEAKPISVEYASPPTDVRNGTAVAALVVGILSVGLSSTDLGVILGGIAIVLGIGALVRAQALPRHIGRGVAIAGVLCGFAPLVAWLILPSPGTVSRAIAKRAVCSSNLRGIGQGMKIYANDYNDWFPVAPFTEVDAGPGSAMAVRFIGQLGANLTERTPGDESRVHPSRSMFMLVIDGTCTAKQFICPASGDTEDDLGIKLGQTELATDYAVNRFDFCGYNKLSYGYQLPFGPHARPGENLDARMAILADKGPFFEAGTANAAGTVPDQPVASVPPGTAISLAGLADAVSILKADREFWRPYNSRNHGGEGENVLYMDGHADFTYKPIAGVNNDNIYTQQSGVTLDSILLGRSPQDLQGPLTETDSIIVP